MHTDKWFDGLPPSATVVAHDMTARHPMQLTWLHRPLLRSQVDTYDVYMYLEDDILIPHETIAYWREYESVASPLDLDLGFLRIETDGHANEYVVDFHAGEACSEIKTSLGREYVRLRHNYRGFWIYTQLRGFAERTDFCAVPSKLKGIREKSARGMQKERSKTLVPLRDRQMDSRCRVYHLTNNYWADPDTPHAKIRYEDLLDLDGGPSEWHCTGL